MARLSFEMGIFKMTGQFKVMETLMVMLLVTMLSAASLSAVEVELTTSNDFFSGTNQADDLYTADLALNLRWKNRNIRIGERLFTDRELGHRFDETYLATNVVTSRWVGWWSNLEVGILHVGRGLLGEDTQNALHRLIGDEEVHLDYVEDGGWYPTAELSLGWPLAGDGRLGVNAEVKAFAAPGFRAWLRAGVAGQWRPTQDVAVEVALGAMVDEVELDALAVRSESIAPTWRVGVSYRGVVADWSYNRYGTASRHFSLGYRFGLGGERSRSTHR